MLRTANNADEFIKATRVEVCDLITKSYMTVRRTKRVPMRVLLAQKHPPFLNSFSKFGPLTSVPVAQLVSFSTFTKKKKKKK